PSQRRLWFLHQLDPGSDLYNMLGLVLIEGPLDVPALDRAFEVITLRHESLRTTFPTVDAERGPIQRVARSGARMERIDLCAAEDPLAGALEVAAEEGRRPFDLARGPLFVVKLFALSKAAHLLCLSLHHIVADGWSMGVLAGELSALYEALVRGEPPRLPP